MLLSYKKFNRLSNDFSAFTRKVERIEMVNKEVGGLPIPDEFESRIPVLCLK